MARVRIERFLRSEIADELLVASHFDRLRGCSHWRHRPGSISME